MPNRSPLRPKDAATLALVRQGRAGPEVLMGERSAKHVFMPHLYVFPGGRVDRADSYVKPITGLRPDVARGLVRSCSPRRAQALALAAIRETFEETGLIVGTPHNGDAPRRVPEGWRDYYASGMAPALHTLTYVARAITPPGRARRFHARFFFADGGQVHGALKSNGELLNLHWVPIAEAFDLNIRAITARVLTEVQARMTAGFGVARRPIPVVRTLYGKRVLSYD
jgi:8-oxo-dGTP pyrophosphatase MutT (NUDIX family)